MNNVRTSVVYERLAKAAAYLEGLDEERAAGGDPNLGKAIEKRIIWRELLDLELQEFDQEIERLSEVVHSLVLDAGTRRQAGVETQQRPHADSPPLPWRHLGRFFR